jgi:hypothetical protein
MKQGLVLGRDCRRCRHRRQRRDAVAGDRHYQPQTVIAHRLLPVGMTNDPAKRLDISGTSRFTPATCCLVHSGLPIDQTIGSNAKLVIAI